jgi:SPP1 family predicted phage head-tail adaptor
MLREPITVERMTRTPDGAGGFTEAWAAVSGAPTRAMVKAMSGGERWASDRVEATSTHRIVTRYVDGLLESDRIIIRSRSYNIRFINNVDFDDKFLEITAEAGVAV